MEFHLGFGGRGLLVCTEPSNLEVDSELWRGLPSHTPLPLLIILFLFSLSYSSSLHPTPLLLFLLLLTPYLILKTTFPLCVSKVVSPTHIMNNFPPVVSEGCFLACKDPWDKPPTPLLIFKIFSSVLASD